LVGLNLLTKISKSLTVLMKNGRSSTRVLMRQTISFKRLSVSLSRRLTIRLKTSRKIVRTIRKTSKCKLHTAWRKVLITPRQEKSFKNSRLLLTTLEIERKQ